MVLNLISTTIVPESDKDAWNRERRRRRGWHRVMSGIRKRARGQIRLITLTHSPAAQAAGLDIKISFTKLIARMRYRGLMGGYLKVVEYTRGGQPHIHMVYRGSFLSQVLLSAWWFKIHRSAIVDIRAIRQPEKAAAYIAKYLGKDERCRYSMSADWLWVGVASHWRKLVGLTLGWGWEWGRVLEKWHQILDSGRGKEYFVGGWWNRLMSREDRLWR